MDAWLQDARAALAEAAGLDPDSLELSDQDEATLLDHPYRPPPPRPPRAPSPPHDSGERTNAPLLCYLVGRARGGADLDTLADAVRRNS